MCGRFLRNYRVVRAGSLAQKGKFAEAENHILKLLNHYPSSSAYTLLLAENTLFSGDLDRAFDLYEEVKVLISNNREITDENRLFLTMYANFRTIAIEDHRAGRAWPGWPDVAKVIMDLPASRNLKSVFCLPD